MRELRRKYNLEYREVKKYVLPLFEVKKKINIMGKSRWELRLKDEVKKNIELLRKICYSTKAEELLYFYILKQQKC